MVIAIDGPSGSGKTSTAKLLAEKMAEKANVDEQIAAITAKLSPSLPPKIWETNKQQWKNMDAPAKAKANARHKLALARGRDARRILFPHG